MSTGLVWHEDAPPDTPQLQVDEQEAIDRAEAAFTAARSNWHWTAEFPPPASVL